MDNEFEKKILRGAIKVVKFLIFGPLFWVIVAAVLITILLAAIKYYLTLDDSKYKNEDSSNVPYNAYKDISSVKVNEDGSITLDTSPQELWDKLVKANSRISTYLSGPKALAKMMNAELITQFPNTRSNPDEDIDWDAITDVNATTSQGIIKFKRNMISTRKNLSQDMLNQLTEEYEKYRKEAEEKKAAEKNDIDNSIKDIDKYTVRKNGDGSYNIGGATVPAGTSFDKVFDQCMQPNTTNKITIKRMYNSENIDGPSILIGAEEYYEGEPVGKTGKYSDASDILDMVEGRIGPITLKVEDNKEQGVYEVGNARIEKDFLPNIGAKLFGEKLGDKLVGEITIEKRSYGHLIFNGEDIEKSDEYSNYQDARKMFDKIVGPNLDKVREITKNRIEQANKQNEAIDTGDGASVSFADWMVSQDEGYIQDTDGLWHQESTTMTYASPKDFEKYIDDFKATHSEEAKKEMLSHYTIEKGNGTYSRYGGTIESGVSEGKALKSLKNVLFIGDSYTDRLRWVVNRKNLLTEANQKAFEGIPDENFKAVGSQHARYWLENWGQIDSMDESKIDGVIVLLGANDRESNDPNKSKMKELIDRLEAKFRGKPIYIQKVFPVGPQYTTMSIEEINRQIDEYNNVIKEYCDSIDGVYFIDTTTGYVKDGLLDPNLTADGLHINETDHDMWVQNILKNVVVASDTPEGKGSDDKSKDNKESDKETDKNKKEEDKKEKKSTTSSSGNVVGRNPEFGEGYLSPPSPYGQGCWGQCTWFAWGRFYEIYGYSPGFSGNGGTCVAELLKANGDKFYKSDKPVTGAVFSLYDYDECGHVGIVIDVDEDGEGYTVQEGNLDIVSNPWNEAINDWREMHYDSPAAQAGIYGGEIIFANPHDVPKIEGSSSAGSTSGGSKSSGSTHVVKIATYREVVTSYETNIPGESSYTTSRIDVITNTVDYQQMVKAYAMPFDYLWDLLTLTENEEFVMALVDLIYDSEIIFSVNDSLSTSTSTNAREYIERVVEGVINPGSSALDNIQTSDVRRYAVTTTVTTTLNTKVDVTKANVWIVEYNRDVNFKEQKVEKPTTQENELDDDRSKEIIKSEEKEESKETNRIEQKESVTTQTLIAEYCTEAPNVRPKIRQVFLKPNERGPDGFRYDEKNFVTLLLTYPAAKNAILDGASWLFEMLEQNDSTKDIFVDLTKYLLYATTKKDIYGVTEFDFSIYDPDKMQGVSSLDGEYKGNRIEVKIWCALRRAGYSEEATAGILGNIWQECKFDPADDNGFSIGIVQWETYRSDLEGYGEVTGKGWQDLDVQLNYLLAELSMKQGVLEGGYPRHPVLPEVGDYRSI